MRRRIASFLVLTVLIWLPAVSTVAPARAASACTSWSSTRIPPTTIRVYRTAGSHAGTVQAVDFRSYVGVVMASEWYNTWPSAALQAGAMAVKEYAWYYVAHPRGYSVGGNCYDVIDNSNDQIYYPEGPTPSASQQAAIDATWYESITKGGSQVMTGYRPGTVLPCGADADTHHLFQWSSYYCAASGLNSDQILQTYYGPGLTIWKPPAKPDVVFASPGGGNGTGTVTSVGTATVAWIEEPTNGTTITARHIALQMAAPVNGSCTVDRWLPSSPAWTSTGASPKTATGLKQGYCYRFVVGLTDSTARTTYTASSVMRMEKAAPVAAFTNPANGTAAPYANTTATIQWTETSAPGTTISTRTLTPESAAQTTPGSCAGATWASGTASHPASGAVSSGMIHYYCYRWRVTLMDSAGHSGTWLSGVLIEPAS
ncbi:MAG TPA: SpoIID/LytB domain-containing protein [Candidatus Limnocylindrales bacterium]